MKPTPRPWGSTANVIASEMHFITDSKGSLLGEMVKGPAKANAAHIVKCVNMHEEMLAELERYLFISRREGWHATISDLERIIAEASGDEYE